METKHPLTAWREAQPISQEDLAAKLGITRWSVTSIETGRRQPSIHLTKRLETLTGISREELRPDVFRKAGQAA